MEDIDYWADDMLDNAHWGVDFSGYDLSDEMIRDSVERTCDFFHVEEPAIIGESYTTGIYVNDTDRLDDDVLVFSRAQLEELGITGQDAFDLVMTHECAHRALQGMSHLGFDSHQEELCCDFMAGVRAGLNGVDVSQMENSLADTPISDTHPDGTDRVDSIEDGVKFAQEYYAAHGVAPTFSDCLDYFTGNADLADLAPDGQITLRPEHAASVVTANEARGTLGNVAFVDNNVDELKGYTQSEINTHINKAEKDMGYWKAEVRRHGELAEHEMWRESEMSHIKSAERKYEAAKAEYNKWKGMKSDK